MIFYCIGGHVIIYSSFYNVILKSAVANHNKTKNDFSYFKSYITINGKSNLVYFYKKLLKITKNKSLPLSLPNVIPLAGSKTDQSHKSWNAATAFFSLNNNAPDILFEWEMDRITKARGFAKSLSGSNKVFIVTP